MLLTRSLPPQFLLPAWSAHQLSAVQRAYNSTENKTQRPGQRSKQSILRDAVKPQLAEGEEGIKIRRNLSRPAPARKSRYGEDRRDDERSQEERDAARQKAIDEMRSWPPIPADTFNNPPVSRQKKQAKEEETLLKPQKIKPKKRKTEALSLFDQLFPEERHTKSPEQREAELRFDKLPAFNWTPEINIEKPAVKPEKQDTYYQIPRRNASSGFPLSNDHVSVRKARETMRRTTDEQDWLQSNDGEKGILVLNACSKTLEESDFFRLSPTGQHIEGWKSGLLKVIPTRDNKTLETLGSYILVFSSRAAARAYLDQTMRLHTLTKLYKRNKEARFPLPPGYLKEGENMENLIKGFSLVPGFNKLSLRMLSTPYSSRMKKLIQDGGPAAIAGREAGAEHMVLFTTDRSSITHADLVILLRQDGKRRNMNWNVTSSMRESVIRLQINELGEPVEGKRFGGGARRYQGPERFIISFKDSHEARRFVREWHCRPLPMQQQVKRAEDEPPPIVNAEILW